MPQPAPARFDAADRRALAASLLTATGPTLTLCVLVGGYALSAHVCAENVNWLITACIGVGALGTIAAWFGLTRVLRDQPEHGAPQRLRSVAISLQAFSLLVIAAFALAMRTVSPCG